MHNPTTVTDFDLHSHLHSPNKFDNDNVNELGYLNSDQKSQIKRYND